MNASIGLHTYVKFVAKSFERSFFGVCLKLYIFDFVACLYCCDGGYPNSLKGILLKLLFHLNCSGQGTLAGVPRRWIGS
jgi:hypothetical protein